MSVKSSRRRQHAGLFPYSSSSSSSSLQCSNSSLWCSSNMSDGNNVSHPLHLFKWNPHIPKKKERNSTHTEYKENDIIWNFTVHSFTTLIMIRIKIFNEREIGNTNNLYHTRHISDISMAEESRKSMVFCFVCNAVLAILPHSFALHIYTIHEYSKMLRKSYPKCRFFCWCDANWRWQWKVLSQTLHVRDSSGDFFKTRPQKEHIEQGEDKKNVE